MERRDSHSERALDKLLALQTKTLDLNKLMERLDGPPDLKIKLLFKEQHKVTDPRKLLLDAILVVFIIRFFGRSRYCSRQLPCKATMNHRFMLCQRSVIPLPCPPPPTTHPALLQFLDSTLPLHHGCTPPLPLVSFTGVRVGCACSCRVLTRIMPDPSPSTNADYCAHSLSNTTETPIETAAGFILMPRGPCSAQVNKASMLYGPTSFT